MLAAAAVVACTDSSSHVATVDSAVPPRDTVAEWARAVDDRADSLHLRKFTFPARSAEGGEGRLYQLADSAVRIDIEDLGEMGRVRRRFYAVASSLRLAVRTDERYDQPMSGNVVKTKVDSTWFARDSAVKWRDSLGVVHAQRDSLLQAHEREVLAEYSWSIGVAGGGARRPR